MEQQGIRQKVVHTQVNGDPQSQALFSNWIKKLTDFFVIKPETLEEAGVQLEQAPEQNQV